MHNRLMSQNLLLNFQQDNGYFKVNIEEIKRKFRIDKREDIINAISDIYTENDVNHGDIEEELKHDNNLIYLSMAIKLAFYFADTHPFADNFIRIYCAIGLHQRLSEYFDISIDTVR